MLCQPLRIKEDMHVVVGAVQNRRARVLALEALFTLRMVESETQTGHRVGLVVGTQDLGVFKVVHERQMMMMLHLKLISI